MSRPRKFVPCPLCGALSSNPKWERLNLKERQAKMLHLRRAGYSIRQIMRALGYASPQSVSAILRRAKA
jgi:DNA-binding CsgD family transcriptional regulator